VVSASFDQAALENLVNRNAPSKVIEFKDDSIFSLSIKRHVLLFIDKVCSCLARFFFQFINLLE
jgi:hypothetical protein